MSVSPNLSGPIELRLQRAARGGWRCVQCQSDGAKDDLAVFLGARRGETKGRLLCVKCATKQTGALGLALKAYLTALK